MRKLLALILSLSFCTAFFVGCTNYELGSSSSSSSSSSGLSGSEYNPDEETPESDTYTINYYAVIDGGQPTSITAGMKVENGQYPAEYTYGTGATFSDLQNTATYDFQGWYIDAACTAGNEFNKVISATDTGNKSFYAKFITSTQNPPSSEPENPTPQTFTISYKVVLNGELETDTTVFDKLKGTATYPVEYTYGTGVTVPSLNDKDNYHFEGWYFNATCSAGNEFDGTISTTDSGEKTLYAKVTTKADIVYLMVLDGDTPKTFDDMADFKVEGKLYPIEYAYNTTTTVDDLQHNGYYQFGGWYFDEECEIAFDGEIPANQRGKLILYAKITYLNNNKYWTPIK